MGSLQVFPSLKSLNVGKERDASLDNERDTGRLEAFSFPFGKPMIVASAGNGKRTVEGKGR
jgi:hypothetical protein